MDTGSRSVRESTYTSPLPSDISSFGPLSQQFISVCKKESNSVQNFSCSHATSSTKCAQKDSVKCKDSKEMFQLEITDTICCALESDHDLRDVSTGLSQLRFCYNKSPEDVGVALLVSLLQYSIQHVETKHAISSEDFSQDHSKAAQKCFKKCCITFQGILLEDRFGAERMQLE